MAATTADKLLKIVQEIDTTGHTALTRLTIIKKWFESARRMDVFAVWLANQIISQYDETEDEQAKPLFEAAQTLLAVKDTANPQINKELARKLYYLLQGYQNEYQHQKWVSVRIINNWNLFIIEECLGILFRNNKDTSDGYKLVSDYCKNYDPHYGSGLNGPSRDKIQNIAYFVAEVEAWEKSNIIS